MSAEILTNSNSFLEVLTEITGRLADRMEVNNERGEI